MYYKNAQSDTKPESATIEKLPDGRQRIILTRNASEISDEDGKQYQFEQAIFYAPDDRTLTKKELKEGIAAWFLYAQEDHETPSLEERVAALEEMLTLE